MIPRDFTRPGRSVAVSDRGMVSTSHAAASLAAVEILKAGGNAVDAALAAVALQGVVEPHMTGVGGDCFAILARSDGPVVAINGSGRAPRAADPGWYAGHGIRTIAEHSPHAVTVPGAVDTWCRLSADHGRLPLDRVLAPAVAAAEEGFVVTQRTAHDWARYVDRISRHGSRPAAFLPGGSAPPFGSRVTHPALARTLRRIGEQGRRAFYEGEAMAEMVGILRTLGGLHTEQDFVEASADYVEPIAADYRGHTLYECPPNGQGLAALLIARLLDGFDLADPALTEADRIHLLAEATRAAYRQRDALVADPRFHPVDVAALLSERAIAPIRARLSLERAAPEPDETIPAHRDTVQVAVVDRDGTAVSIINSIYSAFGSGLYAERAGILLQDRGAGFSLDPHHRNAIGPGKRPFHTIIPGLLCRNGRPVMPFGVVGAQYQAAGHLHVLSRMLDCGADVQQASDAPRSFAYGGTLSIESTHDAAVVDDLRRRGHRVAWSPDPIGGFQGVWIDHARGILLGGADHRKDGIALGI